MEPKSCKLCGTAISDKNFKLIDEVIKDIFCTLLLKLTFNDRTQQLMCYTCSEKLFAALNFKWMCLRTDSTVTPYIKESSPVDEKPVYMKEEENSMLVYCKQICRLCMQPVNDAYISVQEVQAETIQIYIPEINLKKTDSSIICRQCNDSISTHSAFIKSCLDVEERLCKGAATATVTPLSEMCVKTEDVEIKFEREHHDNGENFSIPEFIDIKTEKLEQESDASLLSFSNGTDTGNIKQCSSHSDKPAFKMHYKQKPVSHVLAQKQGLKRKREIGTKQKSNLKNDQKDPLELRTYKCSECGYETKQKCHLTNHMLTHKDPSEVQMYKCNDCEYETKFKKGLKLHQLRHKDPSEVEMYRCEECPYETKYKKNLKTHQLRRHENPSDVQTYKCTECGYETVFKYLLKMHQLNHKSATEVERYKCTQCDYITRHKKNLGPHQLRHKDPSQVQMYKCSDCEYKTRHRGSLRLHHLRIHTDPTEIEMYNCDQCEYKAKVKGNLVRHMLTHKDLSEVRTYKCTECEYECKEKGSIVRHLLMHNDPSEVEMYKCKECEYETRYKRSLKLHELLHKDPSEVTMYKCSECEYETKFRKRLTMHQLRHKDPSEVPMYKCSECKYETKRKANLVRHQLRHNST